MPDRLPLDRQSAPPPVVYVDMCGHCFAGESNNPEITCQHNYKDGSPNVAAYMAFSAVKRLLSEVSRDYAGAHVNAGSVIATVRNRLEELDA